MAKVIDNKDGTFTLETYRRGETNVQVKLRRRILKTMLHRAKEGAGKITLVVRAAPGECVRPSDVISIPITDIMIEEEGVEVVSFSVKLAPQEEDHTDLLRWMSNFYQMFSGVVRGLDDPQDPPKHDEVKVLYFSNPVV